MVLEKYKKYKDGMALYVNLLEKGNSPDSKEMKELFDSLNQLKEYTIMSDRLNNEIDFTLGFTEQEQIEIERKYNKK